MATIDHLGFPHIVDLIFAFAPPESLAALGTACRDWRRRACAELHHLRDFSTWRKQTSSGISTQTYSFQTLSDTWAQTSDPLFLKFSRILDLAAGVLGEKVDPDITVHTMRLPRLRPPVLIAPKIPPLAGYGCSRLVFDNHFALSIARRIDKLVVNYRGSFPYLAAPGADCRLPGFEVGELVFIFHAWDEPGWQRKTAEEYRERPG